MMFSRRFVSALFVCLLAVSEADASTCSFGFLPGTSYASGSQSADVATGDFNSDNYIDAAIVNRGLNKITILLGTAGGGFVSGGEITIEYTYGDIAAGDVNGDGKVDLVVAIPWSNNFTVHPFLKVLIGNGQGGFTATPYTDQQLVYQNPERIAAADFTGDGKLDAVTTKTDGQVSSMISVGDHFAQKAEYTTLTAGESGIANDVTLGDFDHDGKLDFAVIEWLHTRLVPFFGNGDGTFVKGTAITLTAPFANEYPSRIASGDFNGDGYADLVVSWWDPYSGSNEPPIMILLSNGVARSFASPANHGHVPGIEQLVVNDINGDGALDIVAGSGFATGYFLGNGDGTFQSKQDISANEGMGVAVADFDRDGAPDILGTAWSGSAWVYLATCGRVTLSLNSTANPANQGTTFTITGNLTPPPAVAATGLLLLSRGATPLSSTTLNAGSTVSSNESGLTPASYQYTLSYSGDSRFMASTKTLTQVVQTPPFGAPPQLNAISYGGPVALSWIATNGVDHYEIWRNNGAGYALVGTSPVAAYNDNAAPADAALLYKVRGISASNVASDFSAPDLTITYALTDEPVSAHATQVKLVHLTQLRTAINAARGLLGLGALTWAEPSPTVVKASHWTEARGAIAAVRSTLGMSAVVYSETPTIGQPVKASHVNETRAALR